MSEKNKKLLLYLNIGTSGLHIFVGLIAGLQNCPIRELGVLFTVLGIMAFVSVIGAAFIHPLMVIPSLIGIIVPGMLAAVIVKIVLTGAILAMILAPGAAVYEILKTIAMMYGL
ncbi:MAG: hypothetical protein IKU13_04120 [Clostridia bacterium]|nr:hypothetical protein [Clostridia bacterium]MBR5266471.1 hypothetical protein [Clostridia bacterium]